LAFSKLSSSGGIMLRWRLLSASILIGITLLLAYCDGYAFAQAPPGAWMTPLFLLVIGLGTNELIAMFAKKGFTLIAIPIYIGTFGLLFLNTLPAWSPLLTWHSMCAACNTWLQSLPTEQTSIAWCIVTLLWILVLEMYRYGDSSKNPVVHVALSLFIVFYLGVLGSYFAKLRFLEGQGLTPLVSMIFTVKMADAGAYAVGRLTGRHKMVPKLSPGKTWEGTCGGFVVAAGASVFCFHYIMPVGLQHATQVTLVSSILFGLLMALTGMIGDLAESMIKREMGCKDSSTWLRGLGGVLDILDSMLTSAPIAFYCWQAGWFN
jgi:phosphatidate cytidylyltransferase